jgi:hypothetical protein
VTTAGAAHAQSASQTVDLKATIDDYCTLDSGTNMSEQVIQVTNGRSVSTTPLTPTPRSVSCNKAAKVSLTSAKVGLDNDVAVTGYQNTIHYTATASFGGTNPSTATLNNSTGCAGIATNCTAPGSMPGAGASTSGAITLTITPIAPTSTLGAGTYRDTLTVMVNPS